MNSVLKFHNLAKSNIESLALLDKQVEISYQESLEKDRLDRIKIAEEKAEFGVGDIVQANNVGNRRWPQALLITEVVGHDEFNEYGMNYCVTEYRVMSKEGHKWRMEHDQTNYDDMTCEYLDIVNSGFYRREEFLTKIEAIEHKKSSLCNPKILRKA